MLLLTPLSRRLHSENLTTFLFFSIFFYPRRAIKKRIREGWQRKRGRTASDDVGGKSLSDTSTSAGAKSIAISTSVNIFEASKRDKSQYFVDKVKDKRRTKNNNLEFLIGWRGFPDPKDDMWEPLDHLTGSEHMIRECNEQWEKDYVRKTAETLEAQTVRRKSVVEKNDQRDDIDEAMGEGGGDDQEGGESEDDNEDGHGSGGVTKRSGTQRRMSTSSMDFDVASVEGQAQLQAYMQVQQVPNDTDPLWGGSSISKSFPTCPERIDST